MVSWVRSLIASPYAEATRLRLGGGGVGARSAPRHAGARSYGDGPIRFGPHHVEITFTVLDLPPRRHQLTQTNAAGTSIGDLTMGWFWIDVRAARASPSFAG